MSHLFHSARRHAASVDLDRIVLRRAGDADVEALARLEALKGRRLASRDVVVAESEGELIAAADPRSGEGIADPFRPSAPVLSLLRSRAAAR